jgi:triphosphoribosyl-dephospho-CoA synthase
MNMLRTAPLAPSAKRAWSTRDIAVAAVRALCEEAMLTPKPALVDRRGNGAHRDMNLPMLLQSALTLRATFEKTARCAATLPLASPLRQRLARIGMDGERDMLAATGGVNTHRGAIWSLGLLCAARAALDGTHSAEDLCDYASRIARLPRSSQATNSHGLAMRDRFGARGARGEAEDGFPHVHALALPALRASRARGVAEGQAQLETLLLLMTCVGDTCLLYRGGEEALHAAQDGARSVLDAGVATAQGKTALHVLDRRLVELGASPGGSADLLAATLLLDRFVAEDR